jgi:predicted metal-dependent peptidase
MDPVQAKISAIYDKWFLTEPLFFNVLVTHKLQENNEIITIRSGKKRIEYNRGFVKSLSDSLFEDYLKIEIIRILLKHPYQRQPPIRPIGYIASDIAITEVFPTTCRLFRYRDFWEHKLFLRSSFEIYYRELERLYDLSSHASASMETGEGSGLPDLEKIINAGLWEQDDLMAEEINSAIRNAELAGNWGRIPGNLIGMITGSLQVKVDYRKVLRRFRHSILSEKRNLTRTRPNRRYEFENMGSRYRFTTKLLVAVDTSGSVSDDDLRKALSIINRLFSYGIESCDVIQFDARIQGRKLSLKKAMAEMLVRGRGGTNFQCVTDFIADDSSYDGLIIITDGIAPAPPDHKNFHTRIVWLFNSEENYTRNYGRLSKFGDGCFML